MTRFRPVLLAVGLLLLPAASEAQTKSAVIAEAIGVAGRKGEMDEKPVGVGAIATLDSGAGVGVRWLKAKDLTQWSVTFTQLAPAVRGSKSVQPLGSVGICRVLRPAVTITCLEIGGGVRVFPARRIGVGFDLRFMKDLQSSVPALGKLRVYQTALTLAWRF